MEDPGPMGSVLVENIPFEGITSSDLLQFASQYGPVVSIYYPEAKKASKGGLTYRYAYIKFQALLDAEHFSSSINQGSTLHNISNLQATVTTRFQTKEKITATTPDTPSPVPPKNAPNRPPKVLREKKNQALHKSKVPIAPPTSAHNWEDAFNLSILPQNVKDCIVRLQSYGIRLHFSQGSNDELLRVFQMRKIRNEELDKAQAETTQRLFTSQHPSHVIVPALSMKVVRRCLRKTISNEKKILCGFISISNLLPLEDELIVASKIHDFSQVTFVLTPDNYTEHYIGIEMNVENQVGLLIGLPVVEINTLSVDDYLCNDREELRKERGDACNKMSYPMVVLDDVRSAENIGSILRTSFSLGVMNVICSRTSYSALNSRAMRVSMGSMSQMRFAVTDDVPKTVRELVEEGVHVFATTPNTDKVLTPTSNKKWCVILGNEDNGSSQETLNAASHKVKLIQTNGDSFTVSVAASIALYILQQDYLIEVNAPFIPDV